MRVKRRTMAFFVPQKKQNRAIYRIENLKKDLQLRERRREEDLELKPFEEQYVKKMQQRNFA